MKGEKEIFCQPTIASFLTARHIK